MSDNTETHDEHVPVSLGIEHLSICAKCQLPDWPLDKPAHVMSWSCDPDLELAVIVVGTDKLKSMEPLDTHTLMEIVALFEHSANSYVPEGAVIMLSVLPQAIVEAAQAVIASRTLSEAAGNN